LVRVADPRQARHRRRIDAQRADERDRRERGDNECEAEQARVWRGHAEILPS
jgi:hypothetical protein